jgi:hypothetical protein
MYIHLRPLSTEYATLIAVGPAFSHLLFALFLLPAFEVVWTFLLYNPAKSYLVAFLISLQGSNVAFT